MINKSIILEARKANLPEYLRKKGYTLKSEGNRYRVGGIPGLIVMDNCWYDHVKQNGGNSLDYAIQMEGLRFTEAVNALIRHSGNQYKITWNENRRKFQLPQKNTNCRRVLSYLIKTRGIKYDVLLPYIADERIYEACGSHNCVFTGIDYDSYDVRYAFQRSSHPKSRVMFETCGSDKRYSFSTLGNSDTLLVFESVIDLFSYQSMEPGDIHKDAFYLSLGGVSSMALDTFLIKWNRLSNIIFCLDSDRTADEAYARLGAKYVPFDYRVHRHIPKSKDWNEQLLHKGYSFPFPPVKWEVIS